MPVHESKILDVTDGTWESPCYRPCTATKAMNYLWVFFFSKYGFQITGATISEGKWESVNTTRIRITLAQKVTITRSFYPPLSLSKLLPEIGGALGLWLGLGLVQLFSHGIDILSYLQKLTVNQKKNSKMSEMEEDFPC